VSVFDPPRATVRALVALALAEDLGVLGDITSVACIADDAEGRARFVARTEGVVAGTAAAAETFHQVDALLSVRWRIADGGAVEAGDEIGSVEGPLRSILTGERVALNFMTHLSGVASLTRRFVRATHGRARILDTRKTLPGLRAFEKAAVRAGGGFNHRESLSDAVLIKDNHLVGLGVTGAIERARSRWPNRIVEVECDSLEQVAEAKSAGPDIVLLDNMTPDLVRQAVALLGGSAQIEVSGTVPLELVGAYADAGADYISVGALTHSARVLDIGLDVGTEVRPEVAGS
jgi:nicotinate-nucleotide pyrophosphorylase (carboxylating)